VSFVHRWRCVQFETGSVFKLVLKNNGVVRRSSQDSDVSEIFSAVWVFSLGDMLSICILVFMPLIILHNWYLILLGLLYSFIFSHSLFITCITDFLLSVSIIFFLFGISMVRLCKGNK
jgi:hypothetical protein